MVNPLNRLRRSATAEPTPSDPAGTAPAPGASASAGNYKASVYQAGNVQTKNLAPLPGFLGVLANLFDVMGLDELVNRRTEIVKLVLPLQGLTREHPLVGRLHEDALDQAQAAFDAATAQHKAAEAGRAQSDASRGFATVTAPLTGVVAQRLTELGEMAQPGRPLFSIYEPGGLRAIADVPQSRLAELGKTGLKAKLEFPENGRWLDAAAVIVLPSADPRTHTARVRVNLPADATGVVPGMAARVHFLVGEAPQLVVPAGAILRRGEVTGVYVADGKGSFSLRQLRVGSPLPDGSVEVLAGLAGGETIALDPVRAGLSATRRGR